MPKTVQWKPVLDEYGHVLDGYEVSDDGRIRSYWGRGRQGLVTTSRELKFWKDKYDRQIVELRSPKREKARYMVHRLVATAFLEQSSQAHTDVVHHDKNMSNNSTKNLSWMTKIDAAAIAKRPKSRWSRQGGVPKLSKSDFEQIIKSELTRAEASKKFGISERQISQIQNGHSGRRFKENPSDS